MRKYKCWESGDDELMGEEIEASSDSEAAEIFVDVDGGWSDGDYQDVMVKDGDSAPMEYRVQLSRSVDVYRLNKKGGTL